MHRTATENEKKTGTDQTSSADMVPMPIMMGMLQLVQHASTMRARSREQQIQAQQEFRKLELRLGAENERWRQQAAFLAQMHANLLQFDEAKLKAILEIYRTCHQFLETDQRAPHEEKQKQVGMHL